MSDRTWYSTREVAELLGRTTGSIRKRIYADKIPASQVGDKSEWRIPGWWVRKKVGKVPTEPPKLPRRRLVTVPPRRK